MFGLLVTDNFRSMPFLQLFHCCQPRCRSLFENAYHHITRVWCVTCQDMQQYAYSSMNPSWQVLLPVFASQDHSHELETHKEVLCVKSALVVTCVDLALVMKHSHNP